MLRKDLKEIKTWAIMHGERSRKWTDLMVDRLQWMSAQSKVGFVLGDFHPILTLEQYENEFHRWENRLERRRLEELQHIRNCRLEK